MNKQILIAAALALLASQTSLAKDCFVPASAKPGSKMSTVAPEMAAAAKGDKNCVSAKDATANARSKSAAPQAASSASGAYVPLTKDDNTPWRFDMTQNGKRKSAAEFDAWMKAKGIRVATGKPTTAGGESSAAKAAAPVESGN